MSVSSNITKESPRDLLREEPCDDVIDNDDKEFPTTSIRVLLVDSDPNSLSLMKNLMTQFSYQVTDFENGDDAIAFLMKSKHEIDLVIWDFHVPKINGLEALNIIGKEMDLPVVITSHEDKKETVMKSTKHGACDFLVKPVSKEVIAVLWRHVYHKRMSKSGLDSVKSVTEECAGLGQDNNEVYHSNEEGSKNVVVEDSGEQNTCDKKGDKSLSKKPRMSWTPDLHHKFEKAVEKLGNVDDSNSLISKSVVPKEILQYMREEMKVEGLTRNNVASHLQRLRRQKYRLAEKNPSVPKKTREDTVWHYNGGPNINNLTDYKPLLNSNINLHTRVLPSSYLTNDQAAENAPIQYPSINYLTMNNSHFINNPYIGSFHQPPPPQQQQYYNSSLQIPSVITKQDSEYVSSAMESSGLIYPPNLPFDYNEYFPPQYNNFDPINRY